MESATDAKPAQGIGYRWNLRKAMARQDMWHAPEMQKALAERGVHLSESQTYRLIHYLPNRLSLRTLSALCLILDCTPSDLVEPRLVETTTTEESDA